MATQTKLDIVYQLRQSGASLQAVASHFGISRERVRQLLDKHYGSTRIQGLVTRGELGRLAGCNQGYINKLRRRGIIQPVVASNKRTLWKRETVATITSYINSQRCAVCNRPVPSNYWVYCSRACGIEAKRYKNKSDEAKRRQRENVARWWASHPEQARQIEQRKQTKYQAKKSAERYQTTQYLIWRKCPIPLGTVVRVVSYTRAGGRIKVEWGDRIVELHFGCVRRIKVDK